MGNSLGRKSGSAPPAPSSKREERRTHESSRGRQQDAPLPPLIVLKDVGAQTIVSQPPPRQKSPLINRTATWLLMALVPYLGLCGLIAHTDFMQSVLTYAHYPRNLNNRFLVLGS
jgi:hypothetical protein